MATLKQSRQAEPAGAEAKRWLDMVEENLRDAEMRQEHMALRADPARWRLALAGLLDDINAQLTKREGELAATHSECLALGEPGRAPYVAAKAEYLRWKGGAVHRKKRIGRRLMEVKAMIRADNVAQHDEERRNGFGELMARMAAMQAELDVQRRAVGRLARSAAHQIACPIDKCPHGGLGRPDRGLCVECWVGWATGLLE